MAINGRDAMQSSGTLTLETFNAAIEDGPWGPEEPSPGHYVGLSVNDTGTGISDDVLPRIFEPFFTTKAPGKGSGLGLTQVGFVKLSGGGVHIETRLGEGTSVKVFLPRASVAEIARENKSLDAPPHPQNILVVDEDTAALKSTLRMLHFLGYATFPAESGVEALRLIASDLAIDLVLADFIMPGMSGVALAGAIHETRPNLPVILVAAYGDLAVLKEFSKSHVLQKPYTGGDLVDKITSALN
jgi:CheY-like chemotaxis protein